MFSTWTHYKATQGLAQARDVAVETVEKITYKAVEDQKDDDLDDNYVDAIITHVKKIQKKILLAKPRRKTPQQGQMGKLD